jgi:hypothetical protein
MHAQTDTHAAREFADIVGESQLLTGERTGPDYHHDEALVGEPVAPRFVARPQTAEQVAALLAAATRAQMPVTLIRAGTRTFIRVPGTSTNDPARGQVSSCEASRGGEGATSINMPPSLGGSSHAIQLTLRNPWNQSWPARSAGSRRDIPSTALRIPI